jgi:isocitrate dehydrogenase
VEVGEMTDDLVLDIHGAEMNEQHYLSTEVFFDAIKRNFSDKMK